jgi:anti-anti-sigma factor
MVIQDEARDDHLGNDVPGLRVEVNLVDETATVRATGEIDHFLISPLAAALEELVGSGCHIVIDLSRVTFMDVAAVNCLVRTRRELDGRRRLSVVNAPPGCRKVVSLCGLDDLLDGDAAP